ncbi:Uncharacterised protein [Vibrio cholerae]|uniref:Uncharacterized protein n=1 Tax=Vibrio cholerae TaxID=666 RepID=A0A655P8J0_VIBCL|nr:Uncharacterised protein [Vibrio cholerae]CSA00031.1 Uncharacterised protein [Vibrio cholerae]CSA15885.1 Uncharacterised protein [Vibrio cholerae]CSA20060.1 Uncharacterised protein [Vibrio cholerae]CSB14300.1 Uncharacterised protein [Vibrio cholerae]
MLFDVALVVQNIDIRCQRAGGDDFNQSVTIEIRGCWCIASIGNHASIAITPQFRAIHTAQGADITTIRVLITFKGDHNNVSHIFLINFAIAIIVVELYDNWRGHHLIGLRMKNAGRPRPFQFGLYITAA